MLRIIFTLGAVIITALAIASVMLLTSVAHDKPTHHAYTCAFAKDLREERQLPAAPCHP